MPKMKTKRNAAKRFKQTASGRVKFVQAYRRHILTKKTTKRKRHLRAPAHLAACDAPMVKRMLNGG